MLQFFAADLLERGLGVDLLSALRPPAFCRLTQFVPRGGVGFSGVHGDFQCRFALCQFVLLAFAGQSNLFELSFSQGQLLSGFFQLNVTLLQVGCPLRQFIISDLGVGFPLCDGRLVLLEFLQALGQIGLFEAAAAFAFIELLFALPPFDRRLFLLGNQFAQMIPLSTQFRALAVHGFVTDR